jgi:transposase, IS5 family
MAHRRVGEAGFVDGMISHRGKRDGEMLQRVAGLIDWASIERKIGPLYPSRTGELAYPPLVMFKILLLQAWYGLSDPEMESAMDDRLSFGRFAGLSLEDEVPDHSTIWRFRERLAKSGLDEVLFADVARQLDGAGFVVKKGTLIDASLVSSAARRPRMSEGKTSATDPDARFGTSNERGRFEFGYKMHVAVDAGTALVRHVILTPGNIQEIDMAKDLVRGDERKLYADRGYDSKRLHDHLEACNIENGVMRRAMRNKPLSAEAVANNHAISAVRRSVEKVFGTFKRHYQLGRMRYFKLTRNRVRLNITAICYNLRRAAVIAAT